MSNDALEAKLNLEALRHAVTRKIFCDLTGQVLDVRTAVLVETTGTGYVMPGEVWDESAELFARNLKDRLGDDVVEVIDGRKL